MRVSLHLKLRILVSVGFSITIGSTNFNPVAAALVFAAVVVVVAVSKRSLKLVSVTRC